MEHRWELLHEACTHVRISDNIDCFDVYTCWCIHIDVLVFCCHSLLLIWHFPIS